MDIGNYGGDLGYQSAKFHFRGIRGLKKARNIVKDFFDPICGVAIWFCDDIVVLQLFVHDSIYVEFGLDIDKPRTCLWSSFLDCN